MTKYFLFYSYFTQNRCYLLQAELECLTKCPVGALNYISEALEIAYAVSSDLYITLALSHIASIQVRIKCSFF
jgi:hypothetical protein